MKPLLIFFQLFFYLNLIGQQGFVEVQQWATYEILLTSDAEYDNPYIEVEVWGEFVNESGKTLKRPAFWDGNKTWKIRFTPPDSNMKWTWTTFSSNSKDSGLNDQTGAINSVVNTNSNSLLKNGLLTMTKGHRNVQHQSGKSFLVVADTPWAIPFRATAEQVEIYAKDRQKKGFNSALMMTLQPDMKAEGPNERNTDQGFKRAFNDLSDGHLNQINVGYFQYYDKIITILLEHEIVPVYQPVFHGYGWKGLDVLGRTIDPQEYVRYCKYLLARYGSKPAFWLLGGDHNGKDPGVKESGEMLEKGDAYAQPTGIHYNPCDDYLATWAAGDESHCFHFNKSFQDAKWLDFQWAQTGHDNEHLYHKVNRMYDNLPTKAVANGEPTYEGMNDGKNGLGWWQGEEAWMQLMNGGTMGVVYGAATLWQWKINSKEEGWPAWTDQPTSWKEAMQMEGSKYVGIIGKILKGLDLSDIEKQWDLANNKPLLAKEGELYISYLNSGGEIEIENLNDALNYSWINPKTGNIKQLGKVTSNKLKAPDENPWVLIIR
ncbi:MAG: DUF4038 domain-containing protein [Maribacter sp.]